MHEEKWLKKKKTVVKETGKKSTATLAAVLGK